MPYRDSKLTCLLRQSVGGNSYCLMLACLNPCDQHIEENLSTLTYASKASFITNNPFRNEDPRTRQIEDLKRQVRSLTEELAKANETISFLTSVTGQNPNLIKQNIDTTDGDAPRLKRQDSAVTTKIQEQDGDDSVRNRLNPRSNTNVNSAANETKDAITGRII